MRELKGYTHFDFFNEDAPFYTSTYFTLLDMIQDEYKRKKKNMDEIEKRANKKGKKKRW